MPTYWKAVVGTVGLALAGSPPAVASHSRARCAAPSGAKATWIDAHVIIYRKALGSDPLNRRLAYWACLRRTGKRTRLTDGTPKVAESPMVNSGFRSSRRFVAYVQTAVSHGTSLYRLFAYDLRRGRRVSGIGRFGLPVGGALIGVGGKPSSKLDNLRVSNAGGLAWRTRGSQFPATQPNADTIAVFDRKGQRLVEAAAPGAVSGPTLSGETVRWRVGGKTRSHRLRTS